MKQAVRNALDVLAHAVSSLELSIDDVVDVLMRDVACAPAPRLELPGAIELLAAWPTSDRSTLGAQYEVFLAAGYERQAESFHRQGMFACARECSNRAAELLAGIAAKEHAA